MVTKKNKQGYYLNFYKCGYTFKNNTVDKETIVYEGNIHNCSKDLLEGVKIAKNYEYVIICIVK